MSDLLKNIKVIYISLFIKWGIKCKLNIKIKNAIFKYVN